MADVPGLEPRTTESKSVVLPLHHTPINFGTLARIRTERTLPFERSDFANLSTRAYNIQHPIAGILFYPNINLCHNPDQ